MFVVFEKFDLEVHFHGSLGNGLVRQGLTELNLVPADINCVKESK